MAEMLFPADKGHHSVLESFGGDVGTLRQMQVAKAQAQILAGSGDITLDHLRRSILIRGGK